MKRMGMVMLVTIFVIGNLLAAEETVESGTAVQTVGNGASTKVSLALTESKATLWFTESSAGTSAGSNLDKYTLTLIPNSDLSSSDLPKKTEGNDVHGSGSSLYLNWNIISNSNLGVYLKVEGLMKGVESNPDTLGWSVSWVESSNQVTIGQSNDSSSSLKAERLVTTKTTKTYGESGSILLTILTENAYGLKPDTYKATLTATVRTI
ncbi:MAG: hypothetical protein SPF69_09590 [Candidatus Ornithospirochaeta sp.]|nr:hypothetical protein [Sphaerochaetaceae bacterium]MDY5524313.1 hypothetical protein [Candidatus Ornithospirochaeta sp.]